MATPTTSRQNSRFSSLNVFKFASSPKPPPLPPKDMHYLPNPSLPSLNHSLSPDSFTSQPVTPASAQYARMARSPSPTPSYAPSRMNMSPASSSSALSPESAGFRRGLQKLSSFGRRPKTPKPHETQPSQPPELVEDPSISLPWNFQHNLHVDENCSGLPPTWAAKLGEMGLSEEEIASINARRAVARSQNARSIYSVQTDGNIIMANGLAPSLLRGLSGASTSQTSLSSGSPSHYRNISIAASSEITLGSTLDHVSLNHRPTPRPPPAVPPPTRPIPVPSEVSSTVLNTTGSKDSVPRTPPRRAYHVMNDSLTGVSPPPAYTSARREALLKDVNEELVAPPRSEKLLNDRSSSLSPPAAASTSSSPVAAPPRLSLQRDSLGDLSTWTESLFSIIPAAKVDTSPPKSTSGSSFASSPPSNTVNRSPASTRLRAKSHSRSSSSNLNLPPQKPIPLHELPPRATLAPPSANSTPPSSANLSNPLWHEVMEMVRPPGEGSTRPHSLTKPKSTPALSSTSSASSSSWVPPTPEPPLPVSDSLPHPRTSPAPDGTRGDDAHWPNDGEDVLLSVRPREKENRDSDLSTMTVVPATIVRGAVARSARGNLVLSPSVSPVESDDDHNPLRQSVFLAAAREVGNADNISRRSQSPMSSASRSSSSSVSTTAFGSGSVSGFAKVSPAPSPRVATFAEAEQDQESRVVKTKSILPELNLDLGIDLNLDALHHPSILISDILATGVLSEPNTALPSAPLTPVTPVPRYPGWVSEVVAPLSEFIDESVDPRALYGDLREVGEGENGSVYAARVLAPTGKSSTSEVAIKNVPLLPNGSPKLSELQRELTLMRDVKHLNVLRMEDVLVDVIEDALWIRMELMERSLADIVVLVEEGVVVQEKSIAQFASDILHALSYLQSLGIAHRDLRSDNLLVSAEGVVKIADFSSAVRVSKFEHMRSDAAGVIYWQPPEMRRGPYNALKVDVWSLGATVWEMAQAEPPFSNVTDPRQMADRWPPLYQPEVYSRSFHDFLHLCSEPSSARPDPDELLKTPFIKGASGRAAVKQLLADCRAVEERLSRRQSTDSDGTVSLS